MSHVLRCPQILHFTCTMKNELIEYLILKLSLIFVSPEVSKDTSFSTCVTLYSGKTRPSTPLGEGFEVKEALD